MNFITEVKKAKDGYNFQKFILRFEFLSMATYKPKQPKHWVVGGTIDYTKLIIFVL